MMSLQNLPEQLSGNDKYDLSKSFQNLKEKAIDYDYFNNFIEAGKRAKEVRDYGKPLIKKGASYRYVVSCIRKKIKELGAIPAFPPQIALNEVAAHFLPRSGEDIVFSNEVIKLDVGVCYKGAIGDCAATIDLSGKYQSLVDSVEKALSAAEEIIEVGLPIQEIGRVIQNTIESYGFKPVKNLAGHGLGHYCVHKEPMIPNCFYRMKEKIKPGMTFAIEPFATNGEGFIIEKGMPEIFSLTKRRSSLTVEAKMMVDQIKTLHGLPFEIGDLIGENTDKIINQLLDKGIIEGYPPLVEKQSGMVAQAENSILITPEGSVIATTR